LEAARQQAEDATRAAQEANSVKDQFLDALSHELRTPLSVILGYCGLVRMGGIRPDDQQRVMAIVERNASAQLGIVDDLFEVQRLLRGETRLQWGTVDLEAVAATVVETFRAAAEQKKIAVALALEPVTVAGDADRIRQILRKLLSNAIKFSPRGARVAVSIQQLGDQAVVALENPGNPIPARFVPHLFEPFRQGEGGGSGALGLGLFIARAIVHAHRGAIDVRSEAGRTVFAVRLPRR
jgi:signal transduction histidine kinase